MGGRNARHIDYLSSLNESIERALRDAYAGRADPAWLDQVRALLRRRGDPVSPSAATDTGLAEIATNDIDRILGTNEGALRPAPGRQGAETSGFGRTASGAVELPLWRPEAIAERFGSEDMLRHAEFVLRNDGADALGWSAARVWAVLDDLYRLNAFVFWHSAADAAMLDVDWRAIEALIAVLDAPPSSP